MLRLKPGEKARVRVTVNGKARTGEAEGRTLLCDFLRHQLNLYGTHVGCEHGICGACTVLMDDRPTRACMTFAVQADGADITTIEGLAPGGTLSPLQEAFSRHGALQCGFCTAGILISASLFLKETPRPSERQVREMLSGHLCRCTGYYGIVQAILEVANNGK